MEISDRQVVQPEVTQQKFEAEVSRFFNLQDEWRKKGVLCLRAGYPVIELVFLVHHIRPVSVAFAVSIDFTNYDLDPPSITFIDYQTGAPLTIDEIGVGFFQMISHPAQPHLMVPHPILMAGSDRRPFLCIPGTREYHYHPLHTGDSWFLHRTRGEGTLHFLVNQLYESSIQYVTGYNLALMGIHMKQF